MRTKVMILLGLHRSVLLKSRFTEELLNQHHGQRCIKVSLTAGSNTFVPQAHKAHTRRGMLARPLKSWQTIHHHRIGLLGLNDLFEDKIRFCSIQDISLGRLDNLFGVFQIRASKLFHCVCGFSPIKFLNKPRMPNGANLGSKMGHFCLFAFRGGNNLAPVRAFK